MLPPLVSLQSELVSMEIAVGLNDVKLHECHRDGHKRWRSELASSATAADTTERSNPLSLDTGRSPVRGWGNYTRFNDYNRF